ncbi:hypothetical protein KAR91_32775 [Candidatus Pacearchaeota archaeon]|nr:hypothetical protein [Candidatus Pacearchaeota archaeon]
MALPQAILYSNLIQSIIDGSKGINTSVNNLVEIPDGAQAGAITVTVLSQSTTTTIGETTALTNDTNSTVANLTFIDEAVTLTLKPSQAKGFYTKPGNLEQVAENHADALIRSANESLIDAYVTATPGTTETLGAGRIDFTPGTDAQNTTMFAQVAKLLGYLKARMQTAMLADFHLIFAEDAFSNFTALKTDRASYAPVLGMDGIWRFMGATMHITSYSTNFGGAGNECVFAYAENAAALAFDDPGFLPGSPGFRSYDGVWALTTIGPYAFGVTNQALLTSVLNPAS